MRDQAVTLRSPPRPIRVSRFTFGGRPPSGAGAPLGRSPDGPLARMESHRYGKVPFRFPVRNSQCSPGVSSVRASQWLCLCGRLACPISDICQIPNICPISDIHLALLSNFSITYKITKNYTIRNSSKTLEFSNISNINVNNLHEAFMISLPSWLSGLCDPSPTTQPNTPLGRDHVRATGRVEGVRSRPRESRITKLTRAFLK